MEDKNVKITVQQTGTGSHSGGWGSLVYKNISSKGRCSCRPGRNLWLILWPEREEPSHWLRRTPPQDSFSVEKPAALWKDPAHTACRLTTTSDWRYEDQLWGETVRNQEQTRDWFISARDQNRDRSITGQSKFSGGFPCHQNESVRPDWTGSDRLTGPLHLRLTRPNRIRTLQGSVLQPMMLVRHCFRTKICTFTIPIGDQI